MPDTGFISPGTMVGNRAITGSDADWVNPDNAKVDDSSDATATLNLAGEHTSGLAASNFDFSSIPANAKIDGIEIRVGDYSTDVLGDDNFHTVRLILSDNSDGSANKNVDLIDPGIFDATDEAGGATDIWNETLTRADVQDVDFGFFIAFNLNILNTVVYQVDFMQMKVYYHVGLPTTIFSGVGLAGHHPPELSSAGNTYGVVRADTDELDVEKAADPESSFTVQDSGNGPVHAGTLLGFAARQDGDIIHIVAWSSATYEYYTFDMSTDTWGVDELIVTPTNAPGQPWASIYVRSDGDVIVPYDGDTDKVMGDVKERVDYARREGGTWTVGIALDAAGDIHYGNPNVVKGPLTDDMHILWQQTANISDPPVLWERIKARTLDSSNSLSTVDTDTGGDTTGALLGHQNAVSYDDSGTQRMVFHGVDDSLRRIYIPATEDGSDDFVIGTPVIVDSPGERAFIDGDLSISTIAELDGDIHHLYSGGGASGVDKDLYYTTSTDDAATWSNPTEEIDGITVNFISANIYVRGLDTVMAYVYDDGGVQKYNEKILITGQTHGIML